MTNIEDSAAWAEVGVLCECFSSFNLVSCLNILITPTCNTTTVHIHTHTHTHTQTLIPAGWCSQTDGTRLRERELPFILLCPCSSSFVLHFSPLTRFGFSCFLLTHAAVLLSLFLPFPPLIPLSFIPLSPRLLLLSLLLLLLPSTDIVMLLHTTLSRLKRWSHEWSLQFKSTQPSRRLKWIFCIYSCNNDSIWGYYLQTVAEFSAALITEWRADITRMKNVFILTCLEWTGAIN